MRKMKVLRVKMETVTLIGTGRYNLTCFVYKCVKLIQLYLFLADILFLGVILDLDEYIFPWQMCSFAGVILD